MEKLRPGFSHAKRNETVKIILAAGVTNTSGYTNGRRDVGVVALSLISSSPNPQDFEVVTDLIEAGISVEERDLFAFDDFYAYAYNSWDFEMCRKAFNDSGVMEKLLQVMQTSADADENRRQLHSMTLHFAGDMKLEISNKAPGLLLDQNASDEAISAFLENIIWNNNVSALEEFIRERGDEIVKTAIFDKHVPASTAVHLATYENSLNVLLYLLKIGCDPNARASNGTTPLHLCYYRDDGDSVRALLALGASTLLANDNGETLWHISAAKNAFQILGVLLKLEERNEALKMVSKKQETPMGTAMSHSCLSAILELLPHCNSLEYWKSNSSFYRTAVLLNSPAVVEKLREVGMDLHGKSDENGSLLHLIQLRRLLNSSSFLSRYIA